MYVHICTYVQVHKVGIGRKEAPSGFTFFLGGDTSDWLYARKRSSIDNSNKTKQNKERNANMYVKYAVPSGTNSMPKMLRIHTV